MRLPNAVPDPSIYDLGIDCIGTSASWFRQRLDRAGVVLDATSELAIALKLLEEVRQKSQTAETLRFPSPADAQTYHLRASGADFLTKALHRGQLSGLLGFDAHFSDLRRGDPILTWPASKSTTARNKTWELLLASLAGTFASNVQPAEPDIVCEFQGRKVGIAAKVLYSRAPDTHLDRIKEGARQIDKSSADVGFVAVNLVELFPHAAMFQNFVKSDVTSGEQARRILNGWVTAFMDQYNFEAWARRLRETTKVLSVLFFLPTVIHVHGLLTPMVPYYRVHVVSRAGKQDEAEPFEVALNAACQTVLGYSADVSRGMSVEVRDAY